jgi:hypothetical protein
MEIHLIIRIYLMMIEYDTLNDRNASVDGDKCDNEDAFIDMSRFDNGVLLNMFTSSYFH